ncbi:MAG TPA: bifunctional phosphoribosylaminoimidazolecarboxamide formyltransferase/IMP cyclohydrolase [Candidatus Mcinerneyibacteriales bacterium]|nr:bifunctional phosphoribosylaminoimidazolecarboxamide formyltransferase/IMP cyclohydrolase [Candidatus Mcinerneyibacteriales bacterium]HPQ89594.1 bifunctional phosphoribosylaminoimidazolecarboxamide formyltransferase/IMP cyclohydrolase [Candidatus Mcinerneyibacteriales bacterium]
MTVKRALISVWDKEGLVPFAQTLTEKGWEIISTGGTFRLLEESGIPCTQVSEITGFPEILDGRVKTLHPKIHGGLLAVREKKEHMTELDINGISPIDMVVVNLYPFESVSARPDVSEEEAIEMIDIGGPSMIRSAAKNYKDVIVLCHPGQYAEAARFISEGKEIPLETRRKLAAEVFKRTSAYDAAIVNYLENDEFPEQLLIKGEKVQELRYGENPHQKGGVYRLNPDDTSSLVNAEILWGKPLSYNNLMDAEACLNLTYSFQEPLCTIMKHSNPCGVGIHEKAALAYKRALATDPISAYGGIVGFNREINEEAARELSTAFVEVLIAPGYTEEALAILKKKKNLRIIRVPLEDFGRFKYMEYRSIRGGLLVQEIDDYIVSPRELKIVTKKKVDDKEVKNLLFAWNVVKTVKSNAIVLADETGTVGVGAGQMSRVDSVRFAIEKAEQAGLKIKGCVLASDAFFPFRDSIDEAHRLGIKAVIQPGGSIRDKEVIEACDEHGMAMVFTGIRHFRH